MGEEWGKGKGKGGGEERWKMERRRESSVC